jgi:hypothetical protein
MMADPDFLYLTSESHSEHPCYSHLLFDSAQPLFSPSLQVGHMCSQPAAQE